MALDMSGRLGYTEGTVFIRARIDERRSMNAIETRGLTRRLCDRVAVEALTLDIPVGKVFGFLGANGAGKTTSVRVLTALIAPTSGAANVAGRRLGTDNAAIR